jgi:putative DNA primase/helicase
VSLSPKHLEDLRASGLTDETIAAAGLYTEADGDKVRELLGEWLSIKNARALGQCLVFPYFDPAGEPMVFADERGRPHPVVRLKPDNPRDDKKAKEKGKKIKYDAPVGSSPRAYLPPVTRAVLADPTIDLLITEGEKKGLCADQHGFPCIALPGVWAWQVKREKDANGNPIGPRQLIPDLAKVNWQGRKVVIVFDSDIITNKAVEYAAWYLAEQLRERGAEVLVAVLPAEEDGRKNGLDDFIVRRGVAAFRAVLDMARTPVKPIVGESNDAPDDPHRLAEQFLDVISPGEGPSYKLRSWRDDFWYYGANAYKLKPPGDMCRGLADWIRAEFVRQNREAVKAWQESGGEGRTPQTCKVTRNLVNDVLQALGGMCLLPADTDPPTWIDGPPGPDPSGILAMQNGLLDLNAAAQGKPDCLLPPDVRFFTTTAVPFAYDPDAPQPVEWLKFLASLWPDDPGSIATLQEWFGYLLTPDTRQQKILLLLGPKRSGKGTIVRVLRSLVGPNNVVGPTLGSLATNFGLWPMLGKSVAVVSDARLSSRTDTAAIVERLLAISGEDAVTVDRKHQSMLTTKLNTRFVILSNQMLDLADASGALVGRFIVLKGTQSFYGREDHGLLDRLLAELPGILRWAIEGWRRLNTRGRFAQPASGSDLVEDMEAITSPVGSFVRERCKVGPNYRVEVGQLYSEWRSWCDSHGRKEPGTEERFGALIRAAVPSIARSRPRTPVGRVNCYTGICLSIASVFDSDDDDDPGQCGGQCVGQHTGQREVPENPAVVNVVNVNPNNHACAKEATPPHDAHNAHGPQWVVNVDHVDQSPPAKDGEQKKGAEAVIMGAPKKGACMLNNVEFFPAEATERSAQIRPGLCKTCGARPPVGRFADTCRECVEVHATEMGAPKKDPVTWLNYTLHAGPVSVPELLAAGRSLGFTADILGAAGVKAGVHEYDGPVGVTWWRLNNGGAQQHTILIEPAPDSVPGPER